MSWQRGDQENNVNSGSQVRPNPSDQADHCGGADHPQITRRGLGEGRGARCRDDLGHALLSVPSFRAARPGSPSFDVVGAIGHQPPAAAAGPGATRGRRRP